MKTDHINHVILYAKNFYRHTGDIIKDMQRFCQWDGIPYRKVKTPEKLLNVMLKNFDIWRETLKDEYYCKEKEITGVAWESDPIKAKLWSILISYDCYIPMNSHFLKPPIYDRYHLPQYMTRPCLFHKGDDFDDMMHNAQLFLEKTQQYWMDIYANTLLCEYNWESAVKGIACFGEGVTENQLKNEFWDAYLKFSDEHFVDEYMESGFYTIKTPHFHINIDAKDERVDIELHCVLSKWHYECRCDHRNGAIDVLYDDAINEDKTRFIERVKDFKSLEIDDVPNHMLDVDGINTLFQDMRDTFHRENNSEDDVYDNRICIMTGCFVFELKGKDDGNMNDYTLDLSFEMLFNCSIREDHLQSDSICISSPSY